MTPPETLTEEERVLLVAYIKWGGTGSGATSASAAAKLLRIHDALQARVKELEEQYARFAADAYEQEGSGPGIRDDKVRLMAWVMGGGDPEDPNRPGPP